MNVLRWLVLPYLVSACASTRIETISPRRLITEEHPTSVQVALNDSSTVFISQPVIRSDSIVGVMRLQSTGTVLLPLRDLRVAVALADVASVTVQTVDVAKTLLWLVPVAVAAGVLLLASE
jgi:hypothetical protein